jgi:hypothetical protein
MRIAELEQKFIAMPQASCLVDSINLHKMIVEPNAIRMEEIGVDMMRSFLLAAKRLG